MSVGKKCIQLICLFTVLVFHQVYCRKVYAYFETFECTYHDPDYMDIKCWLMADYRGQLTMNGKMTLKRDLPTINLNFRFTLGLKAKNVTYLNMDIDICSALGAAFTNPVTRLLSEEIRRTSNFPLGCPLKKGVEYVIDNFTIEQKYIPPFAPLMIWMADSVYTTNSAKTKILIINCTGKVDTKIKKYKTTV